MRYIGPIFDVQIVKYAVSILTSKNGKILFFREIKSKT